MEEEEYLSHHRLAYGDDPILLASMALETNKDKIMINSRRYIFFNNKNCRRFICILMEI